MNDDKFWMELHALWAWVLKLCLTAFLLFILVLVNILFFEAVVNFPKKKRLLERYVEDGVEVEGWIVSRQEYNGIVARYAYPMPNNDQMCIYKPHLRIPNCPLSGSELTVLLLDQYPKSGFPKVLIDKRHELLGGRYRACRVVFCILVIIGTKLLLHRLTQWWYPVTMFGVASLIGFPYSVYLYRMWQHGMLHATASTKPVRYRKIIPFAEKQKRLSKKLGLSTISEQEAEPLIPRPHYE